MALSKITTASLADDSVTGAKIENNPTIAGNLTVSGGFIPSESTSNRNILINGNMHIYQRGSSVITGNAGAYALDRWHSYQYGGGHGTVTRDTTVPTGEGFANSLKIDVTQAESSMAAGDLYVLRQFVEGQFLQKIRKGTSSAKKLTLQFWVRSPKTGVHIVELYDADNTRFVSKSYTITSADTWQYVTVTFPADTTGAFGDDNGGSLIVQWWLGAGSTYSGGSSLGTTWGTTANVRAVGQVNVYDNTSNNFYLTACQLELGEVATPFEHESYGDSLQRCQRYFVMDKAGTVYKRFLQGVCTTTTWTECLYYYPVTMRATPSIGSSGTVGDYLIEVNSGASAATSENPSRSSHSSETYCCVNLRVSGTTLTIGENCQITAYNTTDAYLSYDAEL